MQLFILSHIFIQDLAQLFIVFLTLIKKNSFGVSCYVLVKPLCGKKYLDAQIFFHVTVEKKQQNGSFLPSCLKEWKKRRSPIPPSVSGGQNTGMLFFHAQ